MEPRHICQRRRAPLVQAGPRLSGPLPRPHGTVRSLQQSDLSDSAAKETKGGICMLIKDVQRPKAFV